MSERRVKVHEGVRGEVVSGQPQVGAALLDGKVVVVIRDLIAMFEAELPEDAFISKESLIDATTQLAEAFEDALLSKEPT